MRRASTQQPSLSTNAIPNGVMYYQRLNIMSMEQKGDSEEGSTKAKETHIVSGVFGRTAGVLACSGSISEFAATILSI